MKIISANIARAFSESQPGCGVSYGEYSAAFESKTEYLEALMENFKLGQEALKRQLPIGKATIRAHAVHCIVGNFFNTVLKYCALAILKLTSCEMSR